MLAQSPKISSSPEGKASAQALGQGTVLTLVSAIL